VVLAQVVVARLAELDPLRRNRFLILFAQEHARVAEAAGCATRDALMELVSPLGDMALPRPRPR
jgi:hypothetical protein